MIEIMFTDGTVITGATYREAENALRASAWNTYPTRRAFRREMRRRAVLWAGKGAVNTVRPPQTSKSFLYSLARAGLCRIDKSDGKEIT